MRRDLGIKYKNMTPPELLATIYQRNLSKYFDWTAFRSWRLEGDDSLWITSRSTFDPITVTGSYGLFSTGTRSPNCPTKPKNSILRFRLTRLLLCKRKISTSGSSYRMSRAIGPGRHGCILHRFT